MTRPWRDDEATPVAGAEDAGAGTGGHERRVWCQRDGGRSWLVGIIALVLYGGVAIALYLPVGPLDPTHLPQGGSGDPAQMTWFLAYTPFALSHWQNLFQTTRLDYPGGVNLAINTAVPLLGLVGAPITVTLGPVAALNALLRFSLFSSAGSLYLVLRRFSTPAPARLLGGLVYGFGPYLVGQAEGNAHLDLAFGALVPLLFLLLFETASPRVRRPVLTGALLGLCATAQLLVDAEVLAEVAILGGAALLVGAVAHRRALRGTWPRIARCFGGALFAFGVLAGFPLFEMLRGPRRVSGAVQPVAHLQSFSEDLLEPLFPSVRQLISPAHFVGHFATSNLSELGGYLSIPLVALVVVLLVVARTNSVLRICAGLAGGAFILSLGDRLVVWGHKTALPLPEALFAHLPLLDNTVPARFGLEVALFTSACLAIGLGEALAGPIAAVLRGASLRRAGPPVAILTLLGAAVVLLLPRLPFAEAALPWPSSLAGTLKAGLPGDAVVLTYPYPSPPVDQAMVWQAEDHLAFSLLGGYATVPGPAGRSQYWPVLLQPSNVQLFIAEATSGRRAHYGSKAAPVPSRTALCDYLEQNKVTDVLDWPHGLRPGPVDALFSATLGRPLLQRDGISIFSTRACSNR